MTLRSVEVRFHPRVDTQLAELEEYLTEKAGYDIAVRYIDRLYDYCLDLGTLPSRGENLLVEGRQYRFVVFQKRQRIVFRLLEDHLRVLGIFHVSRSFHTMRRQLR